MEWRGLSDDLVAEVLKHLPLRVALSLCYLSRQTQRGARAAAEWRLQLSGEQLAAFRDAMAGRNVFLTGGAGVGKSHTLRKIVAHLREGTYALTATTGAAAALIGATTLHSALGLPVGAISKLELRIVYLQEHAQPTDYTMPDVIDVEVHFGADIPPKLMQVPIERASKKKPFLGGFRSKKTGASKHPHQPLDTLRPPRRRSISRAAVRAATP